MTFDPKDFVATESAILGELLDRLKASSKAVQQAAQDALTLGAKIAAARLEGKNTAVAEKSLPAIKANLISVTSTEVAASVLGYLEGALIRGAKLAGSVLLA